MVQQRRDIRLSQIYLRSVVQPHDFRSRIFWPFIIQVTIDYAAMVTVLVLEVGSDQSHNPNLLVPGACSTLSDDPNVDWEFFTVPQVS